MQVPKDPVILLSYVNTQLRDYYDSLEDMCAALMISEEELVKTLGNIGYTYHVKQNRFM